MEELNNKEIDGRTVYVGRAMKKSERANYLRREYESRRKEQQNRSRGVNLYVKNLDEDLDDTKLRTTFEEFGSITRSASFWFNSPRVSHPFIQREGYAR